MPTRKVTKTAKPQAKKPPFVIDEEISFGYIRTGDNKAVGVSLIRHENNRYVALSKMYLAKDGTYKSKGGVWIPFENANSVKNLIDEAHRKGVSLGWDEPHISPLLKLDLEESPAEKDKSYGELIEQAQALSDKLQEQITSLKNAEKTASNKSFIQKFLSIK